MPLVEAVLQKNFISVYVLLDTKVWGAKRVNKKILYIVQMKSSIQLLRSIQVVH